MPKGTDPGTVTIPQYRVNKTKQHTHTLVPCSLFPVPTRPHWENMCSVFPVPLVLTGKPIPDTSNVKHGFVFRKGDLTSWAWKLQQAQCWRAAQIAASFPGTIQSRSLIRIHVTPVQGKSICRVLCMQEIKFWPPLKYVFIVSAALNANPSQDVEKNTIKTVHDTSVCVCVLCVYVCAC